MRLENAQTVFAVDGLHKIGEALGIPGWKIHRYAYRQMQQSKEGERDHG